MTKVKGDLLELAKQGKYDAIVHGCNCFHTMGAGIAKQIKFQFPKAYVADCTLTEIGDKSKLGDFSLAFIDDYQFEIINAYTQYDHTGPNPVDYDAIRKVFEKINIAYEGKTIGIPAIGAGLAGGDWKRIEKIIDQATPNVSIELVEFVPG